MKGLYCNTRPIPLCFWLSESLCCICIASSYPYFEFKETKAAVSGCMTVREPTLLWIRQNPAPPEKAWNAGSPCKYRPTMGFPWFQSGVFATVHGIGREDFLLLASARERSTAYATRLRAVTWNSEIGDVGVSTKKQERGRVFV